MSEKVIEVLHKIPFSKRKEVAEVTLDLAPTMEKIVKSSFPRAKLVPDRFHIQQLASESVQEIRISYRWNAIEQENKVFELAKELGKRYIAEILKTVIPQSNY